MDRIKKRVFIFLSAGCFISGTAGCASVLDIPKKIWGSSTRALEAARSDASAKVFTCTPDACFDAVVAMTVDDLKAAPPRGRMLDLFLKDIRRRRLVLMKVPGAVDTTEVGVFFTVLDKDRTRVEVSSLSTNAKLTAASLIFAELARIFPADESLP